MRSYEIELFVFGDFVGVKDDGLGGRRGGYEVPQATGTGEHGRTIAFVL